MQGPMKTKTASSTPTDAPTNLTLKKTPRPGTQRKGRGYNPAK